MKRRTFLFKSPVKYLFAAFGFGSSYSVVGSSSKINYKNQNWKVTTTVKFPREMTKEEFIKESEKWTSSSKGENIFSSFEKEGKIISSRTEWKPDQKIRTIVFRSYQDGIDWENACLNASVKNREARSKLGYFITVESKFVKSS